MGSVTPPSSSNISTHDRSAEAFQQKLSQISNEFGLNIPRVPELAVPNAPKTTQEKLISLIKWLFWQHSSCLENALLSFREDVVANPTSQTPEVLFDVLWKHCPKSTGSSYTLKESAVRLQHLNRSASHFGDSSYVTSAPASFSSDTTTLINHNSASDLWSSSDPTNMASKSNLDTPKAQKAQPLEHKHLKALPTQGLFVKELPPKLLQASLQVRIGCIRAVQSCDNLTLDGLADAYEQSWEDYDIFWRAIKARTLNWASLPSRGARSGWQGNNSKAMSLTGKMIQGKATDESLFHLELDPLKPLPENRTCRFHRHFGANRFLRLRMPAKLIDHPAHEFQFQKRLNEWFLTEMELAGYWWRVFYIRPYKNSKLEKKEEGKKKPEFEVQLFATKGPDVQPISLSQMLHWFLPFHMNKDLSMQKAFARIELGLSKTFTTLTFDPSQIWEVKNKYSDGSCRDPSLNENSITETEDTGAVMNDGCARISLYAAQLVWAKLGKSGRCPSAFQARVGPWKGVWMVAGDSAPLNRNDIWIEVTPSQKKFTPHEQPFLGQPCYDNELIDRDRMTFEVLTWSSKPVSSRLYRDFLPILEDRGVKRHQLSKYIEKVLESERREFDSVLKSPKRLYRWIQSKNFQLDENGEETSPTAEELPTNFPSFLPRTDAGEILKMLDSGFEVGKLKYLNKKVQDFAEYYFKRLTKDLAIPIARSTYVIGVPDPTGCLAPHEIYIGFSEDFNDEPFPFLNNVDVLVARHPALRRSDIQKVRAVFKPELAHLRDVVVFSTRGCKSLPEMLQGGDYDGDKFWLCWEPNIVEPFLNALQPTDTPKPESLGISKDSTNIRDVFASSHESCSFQALDELLRRCFKASLLPNLLGFVTNLHSKVRYMQNAVATPEVGLLADLHDYLIDSSKNGYAFSRQDLNDQQSRFKGWRWWAQAEQICQAYLDNSSENLEKYKSQDIIDHLIFEVANPKIKAISDKLKILDTSVDKPDDDIVKLYFEVNTRGSTAARSQLTKLTECLSNLRKDWKDQRYIAVNKKDKNTGGKNEYLKSKDEICRAFEALQPDSGGLGLDSEITGWTDRVWPSQPTYWDFLKASTIFALNTTVKGQEFAFACAGFYLCWAKAVSSNERPILVTPPIYAGFKMRKLKRARLEVGREELMESDTEMDESGTGISCTENVVDAATHQHLPFGLDGATDAVEDGNEGDEGDSFFDAMQSLSQEMEDTILKSPKRRRLLPLKGDVERNDEEGFGA